MHKTDPYVYENTDILKNKFGIRNQEKLDELEADFTIVKLANLAMYPMLGDYSIDHLCKMHKYIFEDIFEWAGEFRTINIEKPEASLAGLSVQYSSCEAIRADLEASLISLKNHNWQAISAEEKAEAFAKGLAQVWKVHAFREGNTRVATHFCCQYYDSQNEPINRKLFEENIKYFRNALVAANAVFDDIGDRSDMSFLYKIVLESIQ